MKVATAKEIQQDILSAQVALLERANAVIAQAKAEPNHESNLSSLGFAGAANKLAEARTAAKELADQADMYSYEYPRLKFIPSAAMVEVCKKYGLAIGHVSRYLGEVPPWALKQIAANKHHIGEEQYYDDSAAEAAARELYEKRKDEFGGKLQVCYGGNMRYGHSGYEEVGKRQGNQYNYEVRVEEIDVKVIYLGGEAGMLKRSNLHIAAPQKDMRLGHRERVNEHGQIVALDPIVCLPVKGGYIVLAAWGEEGQDPRVFNVDNN